MSSVVDPLEAEIQAGSLAASEQIVEGVGGDVHRHPPLLLLRPYRGEWSVNRPT
jgi:hypothetical protein